MKDKTLNNVTGKLPGVKLPAGLLRRMSSIVLATYLKAWERLCKKSCYRRFFSEECVLN